MVGSSGWNHDAGRVDLLLGLVPDLPIKNCWTIAEQAANASPDGLQHLLRKAVWDHDGVGDDLRGYVVEHLGVARDVGGGRDGGTEEG